MKNILKPKKKYGQNFLISKSIANKICNVIDIKNKNVLEIGPGNLALTEIILSKKPKKFISIEIDKEIIEKKKFTHPKIINYILNEDATVFNERYYFNNEPFIIISNLPFNISNKLLIKWLKFQYKYNCIKGMILMFQKELGERIIASLNNKKYGRLSILSQSIFDIKKEIIVSKKNFKPSPKVDAIVLKFIPPKSVINFNFNNLEKITNFFFNNRRKKIEKKIKKIFSIDQIKDNNFEILYNLRAENISKEIFCKMANLF